MLSKYLHNFEHEISVHLTDDCKYIHLQQADRFQPFCSTKMISTLQMFKGRRNINTKWGTNYNQYSWVQSHNNPAEETKLFCLTMAYIIEQDCAVVEKK